MSTALAIAAVTAILRDLLRNRVIDASAAMGTDIKVTAIPPNRIKTDNTEASSLNLFMYRVSSNQGWRNSNNPTFTNDGTRRLANQPLALDLHYLISAYGTEDFHTDVLLGYAMQLIHETPVLTREVIAQRAFVNEIGIDSGTANLSPALQMLRSSDLASQVESIKITPESLSTEEMARLWAAFQAPYRPTAIYQASVVLIEPDRAVPSPQPVQRRTLAVEQIRRPIITSITATTGNDQPIVAGSAITISGHNLESEGLDVRIDGSETIAAQRIGSSQLGIDLPADLSAGFHTVQIVRPRLLGDPPARRGGTLSDPFDLAVHPLIVADSITAQTRDVTVDGELVRITRITLPLNAPVLPDQRVSIELLPIVDLVWRTDLQPVYAGPATVDENEPTLITGEIEAVEAGGYCPRVRIDGIDSPITFTTVVEVIDGIETEVSRPTGPFVTVLPP